MEHEKINDRDIAAIKAVEWPEDIRLQIFISMKLHNISVQNGFRKMDSKNAMAFFRGRGFMSDYDDKVMVTYGLEEGDEQRVFIRCIQPISTDKGLLYVTTERGKSKKHDQTWCYTAHFFDRVGGTHGDQLRLADNKKQRKDSIRTFFKKQIFAERVYNEKKVNTGDFHVFYPGLGAGLGVSESDIIMMKTFVNEAGLYEMHKEEREMLMHPEIEQKKITDGLDALKQKFKKTA
jgi:hypothetical protein